jgi:asparagine synthase (glutamine-hydrolysing)
MCGINGFNFSDEKLIEKMNSKIAHRGPDFLGSYVDSSVSLGHALLSIRTDTNHLIKQPMRTSPESNWHFVFNGEIYNVKELIEKFKLSRSPQESDTLILSDLINQLGWGFVEHIQGMFSIAVYNAAEKKIRIYRDHSGQKVIYFYHKDENFIFSSEIKALLISTDIDKEIDADAIQIGSDLGYIPGEKTIFKYIKKVNIGESVEFDLNSKLLSKEIFNLPKNLTSKQNLPKFLSENIQIHFQSSQKMAINLSGGIDSTAILGHAIKYQKNLNCYTTDFESRDNYEEFQMAENLSKDFNFKLNKVLFTKKMYLDSLESAYAAIEEPNYNNAIPLYYLVAQREGAQGDRNRVVFSGDGGDELFGGYFYYLNSNNEINRRARFFPKLIFNLIKNWKNKTSLDYFNPVHRYLVFKKFRSNYVRGNFDTVNYLQAIFDRYKNFYSYKHSDIFNSMILDRLFWLAGECFIRNDKLYMSQSIELRAPFAYPPTRVAADHCLTDKDYFSNGFNKSFARQWLRSFIPDYIALRKSKVGWNLPLQDWYDEDFKQAFIGHLEKMSGKTGIVDWKSIVRKIESSPKWPGKEIHFYISLAIVANHFGLDI